MPFLFPSPLYAIVDPDAARASDPVRLAWEVLEGGARVLQLRWKTAPADSCLFAGREIERLARQRNALFLVNDRVDVALALDTAGAHLGQDDLPLAEARRLLGPGRPIGVSTHDVGQAREAAAGGADYVAFGPLFGTRTKDTGYDARGLEALRRVRRRVACPIVAIGGITGRNAPEALAAGAEAVAMISAILDTPSVTDQVRLVLDRLENV